MRVALNNNGRSLQPRPQTAYSEVNEWGSLLGSSNKPVTKMRLLLLLGLRPRKLKGIGYRMEKW